MLRRFFATIPPALNRLAVGSLALLVLKIFVLNAIAAPILGFYEIGVIVDGLLASVLASYVFYLIVVHTRELSEKDATSPHITKWAQMVVRDCMKQLNDIAGASKVALDLETVTEDVVREALSRVDPHSNAPLNFWPARSANWFQYWEYHRTRTTATISKIFAQLLFVDAKMVTILSAIDDCGHFNTIRTVASLPLKNKDSTAFATEFYRYCVECRNLSGYLKGIET